jgi:hypothetical protein
MPHKSPRIAKRYRRQYRREHKDEYNAWKRKWRAEHPELRAAMDDRYRKKHAVSLKKMESARRATPKRKKYLRAWRRKNRQHIRRYNSTYRARLKKAG